MKVEAVHPYEASLGRVLERLFDESAIHEKNSRLGHRNVSVEALDRDDSAVKLVVEREVTTSTKIPGALAGFHREWNTVRQEEHWVQKNDDEWHCEFRIHVDGVPAKIRGTMRLVDDEGSRCTNHVSLDVRCDIPLLGKKVAQFLADDSREKLNVEHQVMRELI